MPKGYLCCQNDQKKLGCTVFGMIFHSHHSQFTVNLPLACLLCVNLTLQGITTVLEFPLTLTISVPAQTPNWSIVADLTSTLSRIRRSPLQVVPQ